MAEFKDVIKQQKRMCEAIGKCNKCPLCSMDYDCRFAAMIDGDYDQAEAEVIERIVMDWAEKNPELRYPSWHEAWKQLFPGGQGSPCPASFDMKYEPEWCGRDGCDKCRNRPIPADIAEKLGIKPVGGKDDA